MIGFDPILTRKAQILFLLCTLFLLTLACSADTPTTESSPQMTENIVDAEAIRPPLVESDQFQVYVPNISSSNLTAPSNSPGIEGGYDPHVNVETNSSNIKVGETITVIGYPIQITAPTYALVVRDEGVQDSPPMVMATHENVITLGSGSSMILELTSTQVDLHQAAFILRAIAPGRTTVTINAVGDVQTSYPEPGTILGEGSGSILITVGGG